METPDAVDLFGGDSDTTTDEDDAAEDNIGAQDVHPAAETIESPPPPHAIGRALFARAVSEDDRNDGGETKGEDAPPPPHSPQRSFAAQPVKTVPRPPYDGDTQALIKLCKPMPYGEKRELTNSINQLPADRSSAMALSGDNGGEVELDMDVVDEETILKLKRYVMRGGLLSSDADEARDLIARGVNIDEQDGDGCTALMYAVATNRVEIVQELIRVGAALDVQTNDGDTALQYALHQYVQTCVQTINYTAQYSTRLSRSRRADGMKE